MTNKKMEEQRRRLQKARKLLGGSDCGELVVNGEVLKLKVLPSGKMVGVGRQFANIIINPDEIAASA